MDDDGLTLQDLDPGTMAETFAPRCRVAVVSMHTSPLEQPGAGDSGGMNVYVRRVALEMAAREISSDVFCRRTSPDQPEVVRLAGGVRVFNIAAGPAKPVHKDRLRRLTGSFARAVEERAALDGPYDLVHAHYWLSGLVGAELARSMGIPLVTSFHTLARAKEAAGGSPEPAARRRAEDEVVRVSDRIVAGSPAEREDLVRLYGADPERIGVVSPGVDLEVFRPGDRHAARRRFDLDEAPTVVFVGRLQPLKGPQVALAAMGRLARMVPDARLVIVGGDSPRGSTGERVKLALAARNLGVARHVRFVDPLPHARLADLYRAADVVVIPSASESFGLVALEAGACGTPVVATAVGGLRRLVRDGQTGYLVPSRDPAAFAEALSRIVTDPEARDRLGANGVRLAQRFPWSRTAEGLLGAYATVMACADVARALERTG